MPLDDQYPLAVTFIVAPRRRDDGSVQVEPVGTGFIVEIPARTGLPFRYIVTARHVVKGRGDISARFRSTDQAAPFPDLPIKCWRPHPSADVAVARFESRDDLAFKTIPLTAFTDGRDNRHLRPLLGDRVYYLGLLSLHPPMAEKNIPMVRSGCVGALYQQEIPVEFVTGERTEVDGHLIDCRSYEGFSGSPCFYQRDHAIPPVGRVEGDFDQLVEATLVLGLLSGHFPIPEQVSSDPTKLVRGTNLWTRVNSGIGVVTPYEKILEVLMEINAEDEERRGPSKRVLLPATPDSVADEGESEYERFDALVTHLAHTPKPAADEERKADGS